MNPWTLFSTSFVVALTGALMPGPVLAVTIRESARRGFKTGPLIILGHGILELSLIAALLVGLSAAFKSPVFLAIVGILGGSVLIWMGISGWLESKGVLKVDMESTLNVAGHNLKNVLAGILTSLSNPYWFIWWATIGIAYLGESWEHGWLGVGSFYGGHILADLAWYSLVSATVAKGRGFFTTAFHRWMLRVCSLFLGGLGIYFIRSGVLFWVNG